MKNQQIQVELKSRLKSASALGSSTPGSCFKLFPCHASGLAHLADYQKSKSNIKKISTTSRDSTASFSSKYQKSTFQRPVNESSELPVSTSLKTNKKIEPITSFNRVPHSNTPDGRGPWPKSHVRSWGDQLRQFGSSILSSSARSPSKNSPHGPLRRKYKKP